MKLPNFNFNYRRGTYAALLAFPLVLTSCNASNIPVIGKFFNKGSSTGTGDKVTLTVWGLWNESTVMQPVFSAYSAKNPNITVSYQDQSIIPTVDYKERVFTRAFEGASKPDVVLVHSSWVPRLAASDALIPAPSGTVTGDELESEFYPVVKKTSVYNNAVYSLPATYDGLVLVYNKKHFDEAGISEAPADWESFRRVALQLTVRAEGGSVIRSGAALGSADNVSHFSDVLGLMWAQAGVNVPDDLDTVQAADALSFYTNFVKEDGVWSSSSSDSVMAFASGDTSMIIVPTWRLYEILNVVDDASLVGVSGVPQAVVETPASWASYWTWVVPKTSSNPQASWELIKFLASEDGQNALFAESQKVRQFGTAYASPRLGTGLLTNNYLKPLVETAPYAASFEIADRAGNRRQVEALKKAVNAVLSGTSSQDALKTAKAEIAQ